MHYFWVWRLFVVVYCDFGELGVYMGLEFDIVLFVFCFRGFFELFSVVRGALSPWYCIVVRSIRPVVTKSAGNILRVKKLFKKNPKQSVRRFHQAFPSHKQRFAGSSRSIWNSGTLFPYGCPIISVTTTNVGKWSAVRVY